MTRRFKVKLKELHDQTGLSAYAVAKQTGLAQNTVLKYIEDDGVIVDYIPTTVLKLAEFYGYSWDKIQEVVEVIQTDEEGEESPERKTPLAATA